MISFSFVLICICRYFDYFGLVFDGFYVCVFVCLFSGGTEIGVGWAVVRSLSFSHYPTGC